MTTLPQLFLLKGDLQGIGKLDWAVRVTAKPHVMNLFTRTSNRALWHDKQFITI
jgi:hypothetical protein